MKANEQTIKQKIATLYDQVFIQQSISEVGLRIFLGQIDETLLDETDCSGKFLRYFHDYTFCSDICFIDIYFKISECMLNTPNKPKFLKQHNHAIREIMLSLFVLDRPS